MQVSPIAEFEFSWRSPVYFGRKKDLIAQKILLMKIIKNLAS